MSDPRKVNSEPFTRPSRDQISWQIAFSAIAIGLISLFLFGDFQYTVPASSISFSSINCWVLSDPEKEARLTYAKSLEPDTDYQKKIDEARSQFNDVEKSLGVTDRTVTLETNFGNISIVTEDKQAPILTENFVRLANKGYFDNTTFHRIVKEPNFVVIQGGDPEGTGSGGKSVFGFDLKDEIKRGQNGQVSCSTKLSEPITYNKGYVAMANRGANTNGSQFFIMLEDTKLPANYTIFGKVKADSLNVLDKINQDVNPTINPEQPTAGKDGKPDKEIKINKSTLN